MFSAKPSGLKVTGSSRKVGTPNAKSLQQERRGLLHFSSCLVGCKLGTDADGKLALDS